MPNRKQLLVGAGVIVGAAALRRLQRSRGDFERVIALPGPAEPIEIARDLRGIPHIRANSIADLMFGLGYATAEDRLWHLDILHRAAFGRLAAIVGTQALDVDKFMLTLGIRRASEAEAARLTGETKMALDRYAAGVNAYIKQKGSLLGAEFVAGRYAPLAWDAAASMGVLKIMGWTLDGFIEKLLLRDRISDAIGEQWASLLFNEDRSRTAGDPVVSSAAYAAFRAQLNTVNETLTRVAGITSTIPGSNNWAVSGAHTATGKPLLANDPHLGYAIPSVWYECHLTAPGVNAAGATIPGVPGVAIGHNDHVAWGITATMHVQTDLYVEQIDPENSLRYRTEAGWAMMDRVVDGIPIKGQRDAESHETRLTRHGPIVTGLGEAKDETRALALKWVGQEGADEMTGLLTMMRARSADEFRAACANIAVPALNLVFADVDNHIGYQFVGHAPIRPPGCGIRPVPGWTGAYEWQGFVPFDALPAIADPPEGFIATANTQIQADDYPYPLPGVYASPFRVRRIRQMLDGRDGLTMEDMRRMQADVYVLHAESLRPALLAVLDNAARTWTAEEYAALELLRAWDGFAEVDSPGAAIWETTYNNWMRRVFRARLSPALTKDAMTKFLGEFHWALPDRLCQSDDLGWFTGTTREAELIAAFAEAVTWLTVQISPYPAEWEWGAVHTVTFTHPITQGAKPLARLLNVGPIPVGGDCNTLNCQYWTLADPFAVISGASYRLLVDLSDPSKDTHALACNTVGESGNARSKHYRDQALPWSRVRYHPMGTDAAEIAKRATKTVRLVPSDQQ
ncbi:MAG: penicillin acylase family protein [Chloroflexota bacterium]|nr:penicillin acylase family protein [Chloroflexota bacterium]